ncbi:hypothetical protein Btru_017310 [Bulinus truncatus]|nr:hypothetical protein Btru_017310 [Bulinus truncatus]
MAPGLRQLPASAGDVRSTTLKIFYKLVNELFRVTAANFVEHSSKFRNLSKELNDAMYDLFNLDILHNYFPPQGMLLTHFELRTATDMDDSSVNLGLGTSLYQLSDQLTEEWTMCKIRTLA